MGLRTNGFVPATEEAPLGGIVDEPDIPPIAAESFGLVILEDTLAVSLITGR
jgi:hypothetical protein